MPTDEEQRTQLIFKFFQDNRQLYEEVVKSILIYQSRSLEHPFEAFLKLRDATDHLFSASRMSSDSTFHLNETREAIRKAGQQTLQEEAEQYLKKFVKMQRWYSLKYALSQKTLPSETELANRIDAIMDKILTVRSWKGNETKALEGVLLIREAYIAAFELNRDTRLSMAAATLRLIAFIVVALFLALVGAAATLLFQKLFP